MRILVADDEPDMRLLLRSHLRRSGFSVEEAATGDEALERCVAALFDAAILDHRMPGASGIEVARELRARGEEMPLVIFSAYLDPQLEAEAARLDVVTMSKVAIADLVDQVTALLRRGPVLQPPPAVPRAAPAHPPEPTR